MKTILFSTCLFQQKRKNQQIPTIMLATAFTMLIPYSASFRLFCPLSAGMAATATASPRSQSSGWRDCNLVFRIKVWASLSRLTSYSERGIPGFWGIKRYKPGICIQSTVGIIPLKAGLTAENALTQPSDGAVLQIAFIVSLQSPAPACFQKMSHLTYNSHFYVHSKQYHCLQFRIMLCMVAYTGYEEDSICIADDGLCRHRCRESDAGYADHTGW